jgi:hypothetical protein
MDKFGIKTEFGIPIREFSKYDLQYRGDKYWILPNHVWPLPLAWQHYNGIG